MVIGDRTVIERAARFAVRNATLTIGADVFIGKNVTITAFSDVVVGPGALLAENVSVHSENHGSSMNRNEFASAPIYIGSDSWIGAGVVITSGVTIGDGATVGANAVVTKDVPAGATAVGVPARVIRNA